MIDLSKILTTSAGDWLNFNSHRASSYNFVGVYLASGFSFDMEKFRQIVPSDAEVVVDFRIFRVREQGYGAGTALVPKGD